MQIIVRSLVVVLALTGAVATAHANGSTTSAQVTLIRTSAMPIPSCPPDDPNGCGMGSN